jgi:hypothetical protein
LQITSEDTLLFSNQETKAEMLEAWEVEETPIWLTWQEIRALDETLREIEGFREMLKGMFSSARS